MSERVNAQIIKLYEWPNRFTSGRLCRKRRNEKKIISKPAMKTVVIQQNYTKWFHQWDNNRHFACRRVVQLKVDVWLDLYDICALLSISLVSFANEKRVRKKYHTKRKLFATTYHIYIKYRTHNIIVIIWPSAAYCYAILINSIFQIFGRTLSTSHFFLSLLTSSYTYVLHSRTIRSVLRYFWYFTHSKYLSAHKRWNLVIEKRTTTNNITGGKKKIALVLILALL